MSKSYYIIPIFVPHEGCPHNCVFCNQDRITGIKDRVTNETVRKTIDEYLETITNKDATIEVSFFGGTFTAIEEKKQKDLLAVAKEYKEKGLIDKIRMSTRPDAISDYILTYLNEYNVDIVNTPLSYQYVRWIMNRDIDLKTLNISSDTKRVQDLRGQYLLLFSNEWGVRWATEKNPGLELAEFSKN
ncbi:MAG: radical SAM protein [Coprobacillus sp.]